MKLNFILISLLLYHVNFISTIDENKTIDTSCDTDGICDNTSSIMKFNISYENDYDDEDFIFNNFLNISKLKPSTRTTAEPPVDIEPRINVVKQVFGLNSCPCDLLPSICDINCCCDSDCKEHHIAVFSHCCDYYKVLKIYDHRYCYRKNFIKKNRTDFILERLADNLFCIAYDNRPPVYSSINSIDIKNRQNFDEIWRENENDKTAPITLKWNQDENNNKIIEKLKINFPYIHGDLLWKYDNKKLKNIEIPSSGFTRQCTFRKKLKYLENFDILCLQTNLTNSNEFLFSETYNISLISNSIYIKNMTLKDNECSKNICIPVESKFCINSSFCNITLPKGKCQNNICHNIVKNVIYTIYHNGTMGIKKVELKIEIGNFSKNYHQNFQIKYKWIELINSNEEIIEKSGNPGYIIGKPIIIGTLISSNITKNNILNKIVINSTNSVLTVPLSGKNGNCLEEKFAVGFGEDIKSKCTVSIKTDIFSSKSCSKLQDKILKTLFDDSLLNVTQIDNYKIYISKSSNTSYNISNWTQIFLNKLPRNNAKSGGFFDEKIICSGITKSLRIDILYSVLPKTDVKEHYRIIGVGYTISDDNNFYWEKCNSENCTDSLNVELITYVMFHDISTPSMYYYAGGPNLDISLPYDFFYPFLSGNVYSNSSNNNFKLNNYFILYLISLLLTICV